MKEQYRILFWRPYFDIISCWIVSGVAIFLTLYVSTWFYPLAVILIANRLLALSLVCHEGLHGTLSVHRKWNDFLGRYLCAFPTMISFSKYRRLHLLHHASVGGDTWDPDRHLYLSYPEDLRSYSRKLFERVITLKNSYSFLQYYTDLPELVKILTGKMKWSQMHKSSDLRAFVVFHLLLLSFVLLMGWGFYFLFFYVLPVTFIMQPYVILMGGLQHGPIRSKNAIGGPSRTIIGSPFYMWLVLPLNINYHAEHHQNPGIPHYRLKEYSMDQRRLGTPLWQESYINALKSLFTKS